MSDRKIIFFCQKSDLWRVPRRFFETQKEQKKQKDFHKRLLYVLRFTGMLQKAKTFCSFCVSKKRLITLAVRLRTRHKSDFW